MLFNSLISLFIIIGVVLFTQTSMSNPNQVCLVREQNDSYRFGQYVAINDKYLAVSDIGKNKVIIYVQNDSGKWLRTREIFSPADLDLNSRESIFGNGLEIDGNVLIISARTKNINIYRESLSLPKADNIPPGFLNRRYLINLKEETQLKEIGLLIEQESELDVTHFNLLRQEKIEQFVLPNMEEKQFGNTIAVHQNLLLVGYSSSQDYTGGALLFNLAQLEAKPLKLAVENTALGNTVAVSQQFAAVGFDGAYWYFPQGDARDKSHITLIRNVENDSTKIINSFGELSLSGNILAIMRPCSPEQEIAGLLEVFRLDENATPYLITRRTNIDRGKVQNGFLITLKSYYSSEVCIEPLL